MKNQIQLMCTCLTHVSRIYAFLCLFFRTSIVKFAGNTFYLVYHLLSSLHVYIAYCGIAMLFWILVATLHTV